jgi:hypothetical protein
MCQQNARERMPCTKQILRNTASLLHSIPIPTENYPVCRLVKEFVYALYIKGGIAAPYPELFSLHLCSATLYKSQSSTGINPIWE